MNVLISVPTDFMDIDDLEWPGDTDKHRYFKRGIVGQRVFDKAHDVWIVDPDIHVTKKSLWKGLRLIVTASTGTDHIDLEACEEKGIEVLSLLDDREGLETISGSSEFTFFLILAALRKLHTWAWAVQKHEWARQRHFQRGYEMQGRSMGIVGKGRIGSNVYKWARAFGVDDVMFYDPPMGTKNYLRDIFSKDIVVICCELNEETKHLVKGDLITLLPENAVVVNTSRGEVLDEHSVAKALKHRKDVIMAIDVLEGECRRPVASPLLGLENVIVTPHLAGLTYQGNEKALVIVNKLVWAWHRKNVVQ